MICGVHSIIYSRKTKLDSAFFRDVLGLNFIDVGRNWLIFGLPPSELTFHPDKYGNCSELFLMCGDINKLVEKLSGEGLIFEPIRKRRWGIITRFKLPGGGMLGVYQPSHPRPKVMHLPVKRHKL